MIVKRPSCTVSGARAIFGVWNGRIADLNNLNFIQIIRLRLVAQRYDNGTGCLPQREEGIACNESNGEEL